MVPEITQERTPVDHLVNSNIMAAITKKKKTANNKNPLHSLSPNGPIPPEEIKTAHHLNHQQWGRYWNRQNFPHCHLTPEGFHQETVHVAQRSR